MDLKEGEHEERQTCEKWSSGRCGERMKTGAGGSVVGCGWCMVDQQAAQADATEHHTLCHPCNPDQALLFLHYWLLQGRQWVVVSHPGLSMHRHLATKEERG